MKRQYAFPAACALALHAVLFVGSRDPKPLPEAETPDHLLPLVPEFHLPPEDTPPTDQPAAYGSPDAATMPDLPEPSTAPRPSDVVIQMPDRPATPAMETGRISPGPVGLPDGVGTHATRWNGSIDVTELDGGPRVRAQVAPFYPAEARRLGLDGTVTVAFTVDESGRVVAAKAVDCTDDIFCAEAVRAVSKWRFEPGRRNGRVVRFRMAVPIVFRMNG